MNTLAPYLLTALIERPDRLIYLSSGMHRGSNGPGAPDDLQLGHLTQTWLAISNDPAAMVSGGYWHHQRRIAPALEAHDAGFQDRLLIRLAELTGLGLAGVAG